MISVQRPTSTSRFKVQTKFKFCRRFEVKVKVRSRGGQAQVQRQCRTPGSANVHGQVQAQVLALVRVLLLTQVQTHARVAPEKWREYQYGVGGRGYPRYSPAARRAGSDRNITSAQAEGIPVWEQGIPPTTNSKAVRSPNMLRDEGRIEPISAGALGRGRGLGF